jgi:hypothetical protein
MTFNSLEDLKTWAESCKLIDFGAEIDGSTNVWGWEVREHEGKFYKLETLNDTYLCDWGGNPRKRVNKYTPVLVEKVDRITYDWREIDEAI